MGVEEGSRNHRGSRRHRQRKRAASPRVDGCCTNDHVESGNVQGSKMTKSRAEEWLLQVDWHETVHQMRWFSSNQQVLFC